MSIVIKEPLIKIREILEYSKFKVDNKEKLKTQIKELKKDFFKISYIPDCFLKNFSSNQESFYDKKKELIKSYKVKKEGYNKTQSDLIKNLFSDLFSFNLDNKVTDSLEEIIKLNYELENERISKQEKKILDNLNNLVKNYGVFNNLKNQKNFEKVLTNNISSINVYFKQLEKSFGVKLKDFKNQYFFEKIGDKYDLNEVKI